MVLRLFVGMMYVIFFKKKEIQVNLQKAQIRKAWKLNKNTSTKRIIGFTQCIRTSDAKNFW